MGRKAGGRNGLTQEKAVHAALQRLGDQTSREELQLEAERLYGHSIGISAVTSARTSWRIEKGINRDNRTYQSQPRRNMFDDNQCDLAQVKRLNAFIQKVGGKALDALLAEGPGKFHSLDQLRHALVELNGLKNAA